MTGRTHDLAAFTTLTAYLATQPIPDMSLATALTCLGGTMLGALTPDFDEPTANFWQKVPAGSIIGRIIRPLTGGHRMISHSLLGMWLIGMGARWLLERVGTVVLVDMNLVWWSFMIGFASHLVTDTITKEGVPWLFPLPFRIGIPPFKFMRITTGAFAEKAIIFPGLAALNVYLVYHNYGKFVEFIRSLIS
jgi:inner membrane protein